MRLIFAGTPDAAVPSLRALVASQHEVVAVLTRPDAPTGRGRRMEPSSVARVAADAGIETFKPATVRDPAFLARLADLAPDCCPVVAYGMLIPRAALEVPRFGWVNLHFSLLPAWRGAAPVQNAVLAGDDITGACTFQLEAGLDTGPVYGSVTEPIRRTDTSGDLLLRLAASGADLLVATLDAIAAGRCGAAPQPAEGVSVAPKLTTDDARVDWHAPALRVDRLVRACTPAPGAWTTLRGERVKLFPVKPLPGRGGLDPGRLSVDRRGMRVGTGSGHAVLLDEVQPQGKRRMPAADWARGLRLGDDEAFD
jgi:methionyl-tRNA formyltransferase